MFCRKLIQARLRDLNKGKTGIAGQNMYLQWNYIRRSNWREHVI